jgi:rhamnosyltransferase
VTARPSVSVVVMCRDAEPTLRQTLRVLAAQDLPAAEIVVVDNASTDGTAALARRAGASVVCVPARAYDHGTARDLGVAHARGDIVVLLSGDAVPRGRSWLRRLVAPFADPEVAIVTGRECILRKAFVWEAPVVGVMWKTRDQRQWERRYGPGVSNVACAYRAAYLRGHPFGPAVMCEDKRAQKTACELGLAVRCARRATVVHNNDCSHAALRRRIEATGFGMAAAGATYSRRDLAVDVARGLVHTVVGLPLVAAWALLRLRLGLADLTFPVAQPIWLYRGYRLTEEQVRARWR